MSQPSQVILVFEDAFQKQLLYRYLKELGLGPHAVRVVPLASGKGSGEQWVRRKFAEEVAACRSRQAKTALIIMIDADTGSVGNRRKQLEKALRDNGQAPVVDADPIAQLVPRRNVETWILCLNETAVDEDTDYKTTRKHWSSLIKSAAEALSQRTRTEDEIPSAYVDSLREGIRELRRISV